MGNRRRRENAQRHGHSRPPRAAAGADAVEGRIASPLERQWARTRSGAIAGRGYHYQDLVGAWVALQVLDGAVNAVRVVAEGEDDLTCEGSSPQQVQVKSRQERVGDFRPAEVAQFVVDAWERRLLRVPADSDETAVIVVERPVGGHTPTQWTQRLADDEAPGPLVDAVRARARRQGIAADDVLPLLQRTAVIVLPQRRAFAEAAERVSARTGLPIGAALPVVQALRAALAEHADRNAETDHAGRAGMTRTDIERLVTDTAALVDRESLEEAVSNGSCETVDFDTPLADAGFYAGTGTQPGHVAAGLVIARPSVSDEILAGLGSGRSVLVAGPSGIGKSAAVWSAAYAARHVVWYRVHRLRDDDVEPLLRLATAAGAGRHGPVGFVVDGVGTGSLTAWDALHGRASATPGMLLLGSVREEDTLLLRTFGDCVVVRPRLDDDLAARIHAGLLEARATAHPHWREALDESNGLTLEFTHLLTRGRRLRDVIGDQIRDRVRGRRSTELAVLAPVSTADRWGAGLTLANLAALVAGPVEDLRSALARLVDEHLLVVTDGDVRGLHPVRSAALSDAAHELPPPPIAETVRDVTARISPDHILSFAARCVSDRPELGPVVAGALAERLRKAPDDIEQGAAALAGLRLADFTATARRWARILDDHRVPVPLRPLGLDLGMIDTKLPDVFEPALTAAVDAIRRDRRTDPAGLRDQLLADIGPATLTGLVHGATSASHVSGLLAPLAGTGTAIPIAPADAPLRTALTSASLTDVAEAIATAANASPAAGAALVEAAGGDAALVERIKAGNPWLIDLAVVEEGPDLVLRGRVLHVADRHNPDPEKSIKSLAALGLRCLPQADRADLTTVLAGGVPLRVGDHDIAVSGLLRQYALSDSELAWNQQRSRFARSLVSSASTTERLAAGLAVLEETARFLTDLADAWVTDRGLGDRLTRLDRQRSRLLVDIDALAPERGAEPLPGPTGATVTTPGGDPVHGAAQGIVRNLAPRLADESGYGSLAAFAGDTITKQVADARDEPWALLDLDGPPPVLDTLDAVLRQLSAVLAERARGDMPAGQIRAVTRSVPRGRALGRAAALVAARARRRYAETLAALVADASADGLQIEALSRPHPSPGAMTWPPAATALLAHLETADMDAAVAAVGDLLARHDLPDSSVLLVPVQNGVPLLRYAVRQFASGAAFPAPDAADEWRELLPPVPPMPCSDAVSNALEALREVSSLAWLETQRPTGTVVRAAAEDAARRYADHAAALGALFSDTATAALADELDVLADQVRLEVEDRAAEATFAESMALGLTGEPDGAFRTAAGLLHIATLWDVDPPGARALVAALSAELE